MSETGVIMDPMIPTEVTEDDAIDSSIASGEAVSIEPAVSSTTLPDSIPEGTFAAAQQDARPKQKEIPREALERLKTLDELADKILAESQVRVDAEAESRANPEKTKKILKHAIRIGLKLAGAGVATLASGGALAIPAFASVVGSEAGYWAGDFAEKKWSGEDALEEELLSLEQQKQAKIFELAGDLVAARDSGDIDKHLSEATKLVNFITTELPALEKQEEEIKKKLKKTKFWWTLGKSALSVLGGIAGGGVGSALSHAKEALASHGFMMHQTGTGANHGIGEVANMNHSPALHEISSHGHQVHTITNADGQNEIVFNFRPGEQQLISDTVAHIQAGAPAEGATYGIQNIANDTMHTVGNAETIKEFWNLVNQRFTEMMTKVIGAEAATDIISNFIDHLKNNKKIEQITTSPAGKAIDEFRRPGAPRASSGGSEGGGASNEVEVGEGIKVGEIYVPIKPAEISSNEIFEVKTNAAIPAPNGNLELIAIDEKNEDGPTVTIRTDDGRDLTFDQEDFLEFYQRKVEKKHSDDANSVGANDHVSPGVFNDQELVDEERKRLIEEFLSYEGQTIEVKNGGSDNFGRLLEIATKLVEAGVELDWPGSFDLYRFNRNFGGAIAINQIRENQTTDHKPIYSISAKIQHSKDPDLERQNYRQGGTFNLYGDNAFDEKELELYYADPNYSIIVRLSSGEKVEVASVDQNGFTDSEGEVYKYGELLRDRVQDGKNKGALGTDWYVRKKEAGQGTTEDQVERDASQDKEVPGAVGDVTEPAPSAEAAAKPAQPTIKPEVEADIVETQAVKPRPIEKLSNDRYRFNYEDGTSVLLETRDEPYTVMHNGKTEQITITMISSTTIKKEDSLVISIILNGKRTAIEAPVFEIKELFDLPENKSTRK